MSKKILLCALGVLLGLVVVMNPASAHGAEPDRAITPEEAATLKAALDVLAATLTVLDAKLDAQQVAEAQVPGTQQTLTVLEGSLVAIDSSLTAAEKALAARKAAELAARDIAMVAPESAPADLAVAPIDSATPQTDNRESQLASVFSTLTTKRGAAGALAILLVLGALSFVGIQHFRHRMRPVPTT